MSKSRTGNPEAILRFSLKLQVTYLGVVPTSVESDISWYLGYRGYKPNWPKTIFSYLMKNVTDILGESKT